MLDLTIIVYYISWNVLTFKLNIYCVVKCVDYIQYISHKLK